MIAIIMRSALVAWGHNPPPELHSIVSDHHGRRVVTWSEVVSQRRERQQLILERKRHATKCQAFKVWVAYFDMFIFGGWQCFIENRDSCIWIDRDRKHLKSILLKRFPLVLDLGGEHETWELWKVEFARRFRRRAHHKHPLGVAYAWWDGHRELEAIHA